jgi:pseudouridine synthase
MIPPVEERLQKILARGGFASRRGAEQLMLGGHVTVNGDLVRELGTKADPASDDIRVDGVRVRPARQAAYVVLNKPKGVVTTRRDPAGRPTVMELVPAVAGLFPVGRLDVTTEGLLLLTTDGAFAERVSHPRYEVPRVYHAKVRGAPDEKTLERLRRGVRVDHDVVSVDRVRVLEAGTNAWVEVTLHEGRQHQVKRLLEAVGHPVSKLRRVSFGPVTLRGLEPGQCRPLTPEEVLGLLRGEAAVPERARLPRRRSRPRPRPFPPNRPAAGRREGPRTSARPVPGRGRSRRPGAARARGRP